MSVWPMVECCTDEECPQCGGANRRDATNRSRKQRLAYRDFLLTMQVTPVCDICPNDQVAVTTEDGQEWRTVEDIGVYRIRQGVKYEDGIVPYDRVWLVSLVGGGAIRIPIRVGEDPSSRRMTLRVRYHHISPGPWLARM